MEKVDKKPSNMGGRPKGVPNRSSLTVRMSLNRMGYDAVTELVKSIKLIDDPALRAEYNMKLLAYMYPKLKEIELTPSQIIEMEHDDIMELKPAQLTTEELLEAVDKDK